jgi:hypothetical protein
MDAASSMIAHANANLVPASYATLSVVKILHADT